MKKTHNMFSSFSFFSKWSKIRIIVLVVGILILLFTMSLEMAQMFEKTGNKARELSENPALLDAIKASGNNIYPSVLATVWRETLTFTVITNFILGTTFVIYAFAWQNRKAQAFVFCALSWIVITFFVYWLLISWNARNTWRNPLGATDSIFLHAIHPISAFVVFYFIRKDFVIGKRVLWLNNLLLIGYFIFAFFAFFAGSRLVNIAIEQGVRRPYSVTDSVIYSFLNFKEPFFYRGGNTALVIVLDILIFMLSIFLSPASAHAIKLVFKIKVEKKINKTNNENSENSQVQQTTTQQA